MTSSILTTASATSNIGAIPEIVSDVTSGQIAPVLLAPMATSGNNVYVVWPSNQTGILEIVFRASSDNGQTFTDKVNLSNTPNADSIDPEIATSGNHVYISWWEDFGNGTKSPFFKASNDNGLTFGSVLSLSDNGPLPVQNTNTNTNTDNINNNINSIY
ncbi:MAG: hypothetical protein M3278_06135 [Thermoproteota archaeon]|nr:hypothetical protein [Thermoproteota archaeon]